MSHLSELRQAELGLDCELSPSDGEAAHLASCGVCREALAAERRLTQALATELPRLAPPPGFVAATQVRFAAARKTAESLEARHAARALGTAVAAAVLIGLPAAAFVALNPTALVHHAVVAVQLLATLVSTVSLVASKVPLAPLVAAATASALVLGWSALLARLARATARPALARG